MTDLQTCCARWTLADPVFMIETPRARLWRVASAHGPAVLKIFAEPGGEEATGAAILAWWDGVDAARVYARTDAAMLMEWLPGPDLIGMAVSGHDIDAAGIIGRIAARPLAAGAVPAGLHRLDDWVNPLISIQGLWPESIHHAARIAAELLADASQCVPLHGDLHHGNILRGPRGWCAIDPKGLIGDPAYETANAFRNPLGHPDLTGNPARIAALAECFASCLQIDPKRILGWAAAHCALSAVWDRQAGAPDDEALGQLPALLRAHRAALN